MKCFLEHLWCLFSQKDFKTSEIHLRPLASVDASYLQTSCENRKICSIINALFHHLMRLLAWRWSLKLSYVPGGVYNPYGVHLCTSKLLPHSFNTNKLNCPNCMVPEICWSCDVTLPSHGGLNEVYPISDKLYASIFLVKYCIFQLSSVILVCYWLLFWYFFIVFFSIREKKARSEYKIDGDM